MFITHTRTPARRPRARLKLAISRLALAIAQILPLAHAHENGSGLLIAEFNPLFFSAGNGQPIDLSRYSHGNPIDPGTFRYAVQVNDTWVGKHDVTILPAQEGGAPQICHTPSLVQLWGVDLDKLPEPALARASMETDACFDAARFVPGFSAHIDTSEFLLSAVVPQAYLHSRRHRGYVDPSQWASGVTAGFINYNVSAFRTHQPRSAGSQAFGSFNSGLNIGDWRLRHNGTLNWSNREGSDSTHSFKSVSTYAQRDITSLSSQLVVGQYFTRGFLFDSLPYTGIELASDDRMLPETQRGFAPVIRGVADTNARVSIRQGDTLVYEATVPPGAFAIDDLFNTGFAGDLDVTITEADGRIKNFTVPYAAVPQMLRPGQSRYGIVAGEYRDDALSDPPAFVQATYQHGVSNLVTAYAGGIVAKDFNSVQGGLTFSTPIGALAADATFSQARNVITGGSAREHDVDGYGYRLTYSRLFDTTGTYVSLAGYRFSSDGYLNLADFAYAQDARRHHGGGGDRWSHLRQRNRFQLTINQPLGERGGSLYLSGASQDYWDDASKRAMTFQAGYSSPYRWGNLNFGASRTRTYEGSYETTYHVGISVPLGSGPRTPRLSSTLNYRDSRNIGHQISVGGTTGQDNQLGYGAYVNTDRHDGRTSTAAGANLQYRTPYAQLTASAGGTSSMWQASTGASGSIVVHPGGVNFSANQGETMAVLKADGATGAAINGSSSDRIGRNGYGLVTGLTPYRINDVSIDPKGISQDVEIYGTSQNVAPRFGAIVMLEYETEQGETQLLALQRNDGQPVPFGAQVLDGADKPVGVVGQGGRTLVRGADTDRLRVKWGEGAEDACLVDYSPQHEATPGSTVRMAGCSVAMPKEAP